jgi:hypothetical protein
MSSEEEDEKPIPRTRKTPIIINPNDPMYILTREIERLSNEYYIELPKKRSELAKAIDLIRRQNLDKCIKSNPDTLNRAHEQLKLLNEQLQNLYTERTNKYEMELQKNPEYQKLNTDLEQMNKYKETILIQIREKQLEINSIRYAPPRLLSDLPSSDEDEEDFVPLRRGFQPIKLTPAQNAKLEAIIADLQPYLLQQTEIESNIHELEKNKREYTINFYENYLKEPIDLIRKQSSSLRLIIQNFEKECLEKMEKTDHKYIELSQTIVELDSELRLKLKALNMKIEEKEQFQKKQYKSLTPGGRLKRKSRIGKSRIGKSRRSNTKF